MSDPAAMSALELLAGYRTRSLSPVEAVEAAGARIEAVEPAVHAFTTLCLERAAQEARTSEARWARGLPCGPLDGVPFGAKDIFDTAGVRTTRGSGMFLDRVPEADATAVRRVREAGGVLVGKTATHELAWGFTTVNEHVGTVHNPWALDRVAGGSSGGSAAALAAGAVPLALGSDTGGSIRVPSACCGTVGLKPTFGAVSLAGVWPLARTLDHAGPMARTPGDLALALSVLAGPDPADPRTAAAPAFDAGAAGMAGAAEGLRVGVCPDLHLVALAADAERVFDAALEVLRGLGAQVVGLRMPEAADLMDAFRPIQFIEGLHTHRTAGLWPERAGEYGADVRARLEQAEGFSLADLLTAEADRERMRAAFARLFDSVDVLVTPVAACSPPPIDATDRIGHRGQELEYRGLVAPYTAPQDLVGLPACAVRAGVDDLGLPAAVQITGPPWTEARVLSAAQAFFDATPELQARRPQPAAAGS